MNAKVFSGFLLMACLAAASHASDSPVLAAMQQELERSLKLLGQESEPPYFLSYEITELQETSVASSFGTLSRSDESRRRLLDIDLRVGSYELDNTHQLRGADTSRSARYAYAPVPITDDEAAIRHVLWYHTDAHYKRALERLTRVRTDVQVKVEQEDRSADFAPAEATLHHEPARPTNLDREVWEDRIRRLTAPFAEHAHIYQAQATITAAQEIRWYVSSDGSRIETSQPTYRLVISALTKADDGMELPRYESFYATRKDGLPSEEEGLATVHRMIADLLALRTAPVVDPYTGPAILSGRAAGVFFHEVFGHRIEGHRQKDESEGQTFKKKVGEQMLPQTFSVFFDPTRETFGGQELAGFYRFDNEGVAARPVPVIEDGVFKRFLMSRSPIEGFPSSNGHGRKQAGFAPVARQSNLIVEVEGGVAPAELKRRLIDLIRAEGKLFGLYFEDIQGGFTLTGRTSPNAFNVLPILVYRIYPDGREELVRGVDLIGTPLAAFSKIIAADTEIEVFNGICGAESGGVPVAAVSPGMLVTQIEVQKKEKSQDRPPLLPAPLQAKAKAEAVGGEL